MGGTQSPAAVAGPSSPSSTLFSNEAIRLAFRNDGMHLEFLDRSITPVASHFQLIHFDLPTLDAAGYVSLTGVVNNPLTVALEDLKRRTQVKQPSIMERAGNGRAFSHRPGRQTPPCRD